MAKQLTIPRPGISSSCVGPRTDLLCLALIALAVVAVYGHTLRVPWYMDDYPAIVDNPLVRDLPLALRGVTALRGLSLLSFALNYRFGGLEPAGYHLFNILIHLVASCLVFLLFKRIVRGSWQMPLLGALLFAAHPLQTQAVTYTVQRMTCLSGLFVFLALYLFVRAREALAAGQAFASPAHLGFYAGALLAGALALLSKENAVVLPLELLLYARFFLPPPRRWSPLLLYLAPFALAPLVFAAAWLAALAGGSQGLNVLTNTDNLNSLRGNSPMRYLVTEFSVLWVYLRLLVLPYGQALDHGYPVVERLLTLRNIASAAGLVGLGWLCLCWRQRRPLITFGVTWIFLAQAVESSIIPLDPLFEHRLYVPMFGVALAALGLAEFIAAQGVRRLVLYGAILVCGVLTWNRNRLWNDAVAFHADNLRRAPQNERVLINLATAYNARGDHREAEALLRRAVDMNRDYAEAYLSLAQTYALQGKSADSEALLQQTLRRSGGHGIAVYLALVDDYLAQGRLAEALVVIRGRLAVEPGSAELNLRMGRLLQAQRDFAGAIEYLSRAAAVAPESAEVNAELGVSHACLQNWPEAERYNRMAIAGQPSAVAYYNLGLALYNLGRPAEALPEFRNAVQLKPDHADALFNAAAVALELGDRATAREMTARLKALKPAEAQRLERAMGKSDG